jgi:hypothetical protein
MTAMPDPGLTREGTSTSASVLGRPTTPFRRGAEFLAELHELLFNDRAPIQQVLARAGAGGLTPMPLLPPPVKRRR